MSTESRNLPAKPIQLRVIFILNALMMILPFVFYGVITLKGITIGGLDPAFMLYTGAAYIASFIVLVYCILNQKLMGLRAVIALNVLIAIPAKAYIGVGVALTSFALSYTKKVLAFFRG